MHQSMTALTSHQNNICVHKFTLGDVEDPEIYSDTHIWDWLESDPAGKFCKNNSKQLTRKISQDDFGYGYQVEVFAEFGDKEMTFYGLKYLTK